MGGPGPMEAVIFDLDGVVLDSMPAHVASWQEVFREAGLEVPASFLYQNEGSLDWEILRRAFAHLREGLTEAFFLGLLQRQREIFRARHAGEVRTFPEARGLVEDLYWGGTPRLALVTSSCREVFPRALASWIDRHFHVVVTGETVRRSKPHPEPYLRALEGLGLGPDRAVVVENAPAGVRSARAAGIFCVALGTTLPRDALHEADHFCPDHRALLRWVREALGRPGGPREENARPSL